MKMKKSRIARAAIALTGMVAGCALNQGAGGEATGVSTAALTSPDPLTIHAPQFRISVLGVETITPANQSVPVNSSPEVPGEPNSPQLTTYSAADQLRVGLAAYLESNGQITQQGNNIGCIYGQKISPGNMTGGAYLTQPGGIYTTCTPDPSYPETSEVGLPLAFGAPFTVGLNDTLDLYTQLQVLNAGNVVAPGVAGSTGLDAIIKSVGLDLAVVASVAMPALTPLVAAAAGSAMVATGELLSQAPTPPKVVCEISPTLIPAFPPTAPSDIGANLLRTKMTGEQLWNATQDGDAVIGYDLNWGSMSPDALCARPHTKIAFLVRRVTMFGVPGTPPVTTGSLVTSTYPNQSDSIAVNSAGVIEHDHRANSVWGAGDAVPYQVTEAVGKLRLRVDEFPDYANITTYSRVPNHNDAFAIDNNGNIQTTWQDNGGAWGAWEQLSTGGVFPPGAPIAAVSRYPTHIDVFAVATDGSIRSVWWDQNGGWQPMFTAAPANSVAPYVVSEGQRFGGQLAVVSRNNNAIDVFGITGSLQVGDAYWTPAAGWKWAPQITPAGNTIYGSPGGPIAAVTRDNSHIDVFWPSFSGDVVTIDWNGTAWSKIAPVTSSAYPVSSYAPVTAVARRVDVTGNEVVDNTHMDLFTVDTSGQVIWAEWAVGQNNDLWSPVANQVLPIKASPTGAIGAFAPYAGSIQVVATRSDGSMVHTWFENYEAGQASIWQTIP